MVARRDCINTVKAASGDTLTDDEALELLEQVQRRRERLDASGRIDRAEQRLRELSAEDADRARLMAALQQKHAVLNARARIRVSDAVQAHVSAGMNYRNAVLAVLEGTSRDVEGGRHSVAATVLAYEARYVGGLMGRIAAERPGLEGRLKDDLLLADATRLMFGEEVRNVDPDAKYLADLFAEYAELSRIDLNMLGANIGKLEHWAPQGHMDWRLLQIDREDWVRFITPLLDMERTFPDADDVPRILGEIYDDITLGRDMDRPRAESDFKGPANLARSLGKHRVLHFANADAYMAYNERFGFGNLFASMESHLRKAARSAGMMDVLGPNPGFTLDSLLDSAITRVRNDQAMTAEKRRAMVRSLEAGQSSAESGRGGEIGSAYRIVSGLANAPAHWGRAQAGSTFRAVQSMSKLGSAVITAVTDLGTLIMNLNYQGKSYHSAMARTFEEMIAGRGKGEQRSIAFLLGEGFDGIIDNHVARYGVTDTMPGRMSRLMTHFFRWNGLTGWTDAARASAARIMAADMGRLAGKGFDALPQRYQRVLRVHGITPEMWEVIRSTRWRGGNSRYYVTPDRIDNMDPEAFDSLITDELQDIEVNARARIAQLRRGMAREEQWVNNRVVKFQARADQIGQEIAELRAAGAGSRRLNEIQSDRANLLRAGMIETLDALTNAIDAGKAQVDIARDLGRAGSVQRAVTVTARGGKRVGRAEGRITLARERLRRGLVEERQRLNKREKMLLERLDKATEDALKFLQESSKRNNARLAKIGVETTGIGRRIDRARATAQRNLSIALRRFYADEAVYGVIELDDSSRRFVTGGTRPGTYGGEAIRMVMQFKGFPVAFTNRVLGRAIRGTSGGERAAHIAKLVATLTVAGYISQMGKDFLRGRDPKDPISPETIAQALLQSGAAGILGDFLFDVGANRFGNNALETVGGPAITTLADVVNLYQSAIAGEATAKEAFDSIWQNVPFQNVWFARTAMDIMVLNELREALSPGYLRRQRQYARETYGQEMVLPQSIWR